MRLLPLLGAVALLAGCGSTTSTAGTPSGTAAQPSAAAPPASLPPAAPRTSGPAPHGCTPPASSVTITDSDNGGVVCVTAGGRLTLHLSGTGWKKPTSDGAILSPAGATTFKAVSEGKTTITSSRPACPSGTVTCHAIQGFQVRVVVS
jgi:hypothetical protein